MPSVCGAVWWFWRPGRNFPSHRVRPALVADLGEFDGVHPLLTGHERPARGPVRRGSADLKFAAFDPLRDPAGGGVGDNVGQAEKPQTLRSGISPVDRRRLDLVHGAGHRGQADAGHRRQRSVWDLQPAAGPA
jgi:hypothetical protein